MRRTALTTAVAAGMAGALMLTACGGSSSGGADAGKVVYWDTSGPNEHPVFKRLAEQCAAGGGYQVAVEQVAFDQARNNYKNAAQGGQGPDVFRAEVAWVAELAKNGLIADLSGTDLAKDAGDHLEVAAGSAKYEGRTYAVPQVSDALALFYNKKKLADAGVEPPRTWDDVKAIAPRLGGAKALFLNNDGYYALPFIYGEGGDLLDTQAKKITVNGEQAVRGLRTAKGLLDAGAAGTALDRTNSYANMQAAFTSGETAMVINGPWAVADYLKGDAFKADPGNLGVVPVPGPTAGKGSSPVGGHDYVVRQGTKAKDSAVKFIQCMSSTESQVTVAKELGLLPTRKSAYDNADVKAQPVVAAFTPVLQQAHARPWIPEGGQLFDPLNISYADVLSGKKDAKAAADDVAKAYKDQVVPGYDQG
ncbi:carbohydrate ABC transporter substrate-binding protein, CUT1 family [Streptoalloteichus tenebrarius]|uniref:Carbohydrate ABC transporter substrate-binding protein, CUT1 family n=1 Tax=Streptoalloteichus tenebrarius (strain ATCC 17920 / DSM 40477 / JCM 4838 / CBS 697.72 / NBRC 16177 / NCIMB 11028 / NRRL B-12390 / A12253. 1 / ISP 5477) TaxID=1933 RepID=A0ABT1HYS2_STRSD|nr:extracellular solute-binding protein [Streptoalloteichus tenebrarius]MCP2260649.1 carbohydrate ABC transporter substrate-binding protein, CUT1 family [Streptoalloteichus tenebrarius]BFF01533.1 extracellular solute-binding protein [Streptoalloteichus tenebrarius]